MGTPTVEEADNRSPSDPQDAIAESVAQQTLDAAESPPTVSLEFEEDPPRIGHNSAVEAFHNAQREAERLEKEIAAIEEQVEDGLRDARGRLDSLSKVQIIEVFELRRLVRDGIVPASQLDQYIADAGIKPHANQSIPFSDLMRAVIRVGTTTGTPVSRRKLARASAVMSAVDYVIEKGMSRAEFEATLDQPPRPGERHGIEYLAAEGRKLRGAQRKNTKAAKAREQIAAFVAAQQPIELSGNFETFSEGAHLIRISITGTGTDRKVHAIKLDANEAIIGRILADCASRTEKLIVKIGGSHE